MNIGQMRIDNLRTAIRNNEISFPAQTPVLVHSRIDIQWRLVHLYFVHGWSCEQLSRRYSLTRRRIGQLVGDWVQCAATLGYLQEIPLQATDYSVQPTWQASREDLGFLAAATVSQTNHGALTAGA